MTSNDAAQAANDFQYFPNWAVGFYAGGEVANHPFPIPDLQNHSFARLLIESAMPMPILSASTWEPP